MTAYPEVRLINVVITAHPILEQRQQRRVDSTGAKRFDDEFIMTDHTQLPTLGFDLAIQARRRAGAVIQPWCER